MLGKLFSDYSFWTATLGFLGLLIVTGYGWFLENNLKNTVDIENKKVNHANAEEKQSFKLTARKNIKKAEAVKSSYLSKVSSQVFIILIVSFGISIGGIVVNIENGMELEDRLKKIESYLWPPSGPSGGVQLSLSEQIGSFQKSLEKIESMQIKIVETIYEEVMSPSTALLQQVENMNKEIIFLKDKIKILRRQQKGTQLRAR